MHRRLFFILVICAAVFLPAGVSAQKGAGAVIAGTITDAETGEPLGNVNVFLSSTTFGTTTSSGGAYTVSGVPSGTYKLVISLIGYERQVVNVRVTGAVTLRYDDALKPKVFSLNEMEVTAESPGQWRKDLQRFTKIFLGETENARQSRILNPEVINFRAGSTTDVLTAWTDSTIRVENRALGYDLLILLDSFHWNVSLDTGRYYLYTRFFENPVRAEEEMNPRLEHRRQCYDGSLRHFLASVVAGRATEERYLITSDIPRKTLKSGITYTVEPAELIIRSEEQSPFVKIRSRGNMKVEYFKGIPILRGLIRLNDSSILVDSLGNVADPYFLEVDGWWAKQRVADMLPTDFKQPSVPAR
jgi:hypothetical protein